MENKDTDFMVALNTLGPDASFMDETGKNEDNDNSNKKENNTIRKLNKMDNLIESNDVESSEKEDAVSKLNKLRRKRKATVFSSEEDGVKGEDERSNDKAKLKSRRST